MAGTFVACTYFFLAVLLALTNFFSIRKAQERYGLVKMLLVGGASLFTGQLWKTLVFSYRLFHQLLPLLTALVCILLCRISLSLYVHSKAQVTSVSLAGLDSENGDSIHRFWEELPCGVYSMSFRVSESGVCIHGEVTKHEWRNNMWKELIEWERNLVVPRPEEDLSMSSIQEEKDNAISTFSSTA